MNEYHTIVESLIALDEGKTLEFKRNCTNLTSIVRAAVAFANTAGGTIVIGIEDENKAVMGIPDALKDEERLTNAFADSIHPVLLPDIQIISWRERELLLVVIPHSTGPYYVRSEGPEEGVYVRLGSTNRKAGAEMVQELRRLGRNAPFDEQPCPELNSEVLDFRVASELFREAGKKWAESKRRSLRLLVNYSGKSVPTNGGILLFGKNRTEVFPDAIVRCARFDGEDRHRFIDKTDIEAYPPIAIEQAISFIERNTRNGIEIGRVSSEDQPEYPKDVIREAVINAIVHADYSISGNSVSIAVFDNRIEITNPGLLPFGMTLEAALSGVSRLRNRVMGRVFRELGLIEQWGSGLNRMVATCKNLGLKTPEFRELGTSFRVTIFSTRQSAVKVPSWEEAIVDYLGERGDISTNDAAELWDISPRSARTRLSKLVQKGVIASLGTGLKDPHKKYILKQSLLMSGQ